ncbi:MAG: thioredoxin family protein [Pseudomonadota bacterium]|nr:thioredoxin family protein [Pseudomonadota bacterium]
MPSSTRPVWSSVFLAALLVPCVKASEAPPGAHAPAVPTAASAPAESGIAWHHAASDADVDAAFAQARAESRPLFLYWGATWCPPCNQVKATLFNRQDFIARSRAFVPVYIDGDSPGAQKLGARFKVSGYPTMLLFNPQGVEMTRLPGEVEPARYTQVLTLGMNAQRPVQAVLADARAGGAGLSANDWRLLAFYAWDTDEQQLVAKADLPQLLGQLAAACPPEPVDTADRLRLNALAAVDPAPSAGLGPERQSRLVGLLKDPTRARAQMDVLTNSAPEIVRAASGRGTTQRMQLLAAFDAALERFAVDPTLSRADRLSALIARVDLTTLDAPPQKKGKRPSPSLTPALLDEIRTATARADRETVDGYERQSVITTAADLLEHAGLDAESDALLEANLGKSHSPYYLMSELASNAKARGDNTAALKWYQQAFETSEGPATRLQWGTSYVNALVDLSPQDDARIEQAVGTLLADAGRQPDAFYGRSGRSMQRLGGKLVAWSHGGQHASTLRRLQERLDAVCSGLQADDAKRQNCESLLKPRPGSGA